MKTPEEFMTDWLDANKGKLVKGNWTTEEVLIFAEEYAQMKVNELNKSDVRQGSASVHFGTAVKNKN